MIWKKYTLKTTTSDYELLCAVLTDYGITDVEINNNIQLTDEELNRMYADFVKELPEDDGSCTVSFYLDANGFIPEGTGTGDSPSLANEKKDFEGVLIDIDEVIRGIRDAEELFGISRVEVEVSDIDTADWNNKWKEFFKPFSIGNILIKPTWEEISDDVSDLQIIEIDPGMAFGTGAHETTRLCMEALQRYMKPSFKVLDVGTGSGILGIAACKMGAEKVTAVDIDEQAVMIAKENFALNQADKNCETEIFACNIMEDDNCFKDADYDIVIANILAEVIMPLSGKVHRYLKPGGIFISSGIIDTKEQDVKEAVMNNHSLKMIGTASDGDWRAVIAERAGE